MITTNYSILNLLTTALGFVNVSRHLTDTTGGKLLINDFAEILPNTILNIIKIRAKVQHN